MNKTALIAICLVFISALSAAEDHESQNRPDGKRKALETKSFQGEIVGMKAIGGENTGYGIVVGEKKNKKGNLEKIVKEIEPGEFREQFDKLIETGRKVELTTYPTIYKGSERVSYKVFKVVGMKLISESAEKFGTITTDSGGKLKVTSIETEDIGYDGEYIVGFKKNLSDAEIKKLVEAFKTMPNTRFVGGDGKSSFVVKTDFSKKHMEQIAKDAGIDSSIRYIESNSKKLHKTGGAPYQEMR